MKTLFLDVDDTLYLRSEPFIKACEEVLKKEGIIIDYDEFYTRRSYFSDIYLEDYDAGIISLDKMHELRMNSALKDYGFEFAMDKIKEFERAYSKYKKEIVLDKRLKDMLEMLHKHQVKMTIITNGNSDNQRGKAYALGLDQYISEDKWIISGEIGASKPNILIFREAERIMESRSEDCYIVGDNYDGDIAGGHRAGWKTIWYNHRRIDRRDKTFDYETANLAELTKLLLNIFIKGEA